MPIVEFQEKQLENIHIRITFEIVPETVITEDQTYRLVIQPTNNHI